MLRLPYCESPNLSSLLFGLTYPTYPSQCFVQYCECFVLLEDLESISEFGHGTNDLFFVFNDASCQQPEIPGLHSEWHALTGEKGPAKPHFMPSLIFFVASPDLSRSLYVLQRCLTESSQSLQGTCEQFYTLHHPTPRS